jgi:hypothetical protein
MALVRNLACACGAALIAFSAAAQDDHQAHHPAAGVSSPAPAPQKAPTPAAADAQMKTMQAMHEKMMAAKTSQERQALMAEHMKAMQEGLGMMDGMQGGGMPADPASRQRMMEMHMDMMQSMMQMMMDRMPDGPAK